MSKKEESQDFLKAKVESLKKIKKELEGASKMHASQAERVGKLL